MEKNKFIEFQRTRDFSEKLNTTFSFVTQNYKSLFRCMIFIAGPPVLLASLLLSSFIGDFFRITLGAARNPDGVRTFFQGANFWIQLALMLIFMVVSYVAVISTSNNYMIEYAEKKSTTIDVNAVWIRVQDTLGMYAMTTFLFGMLTILVYILMLVPFFILGNISPFLIFFAVIFLIVGVFYIFVAASLIYPIRAFEKKSFLDALVRSFFLIRSKWWSTFALVFILSLLVGIISNIFSIPAFILQAVSGLHEIKSDNFNGPTGILGTIIFALNALAYITQLLLYLLPNIGLSFQYFNLVEMKEAKGLLQQIDTFGQATAAPTPEEHY